MEKAHARPFSAIAARAALALTALVYAWAAAAVFYENYYGYKLPALGISAAAALLLIISAWLLAVRFEPFFARNRRRITLGFLLFMGVIQFVMIFPLRYTPHFDIDAIFGGASEWADTGAFASYYEYFGCYHNNFGGLVLFRCLFGLVRLCGVTDYFLAASVFNSALSLSTMYLTGSVCAKLAGERGRVTAYFLFIISLPFYFIAPAFYTDALTMVFPVLILRLYLYAREQMKPAKRLLIYIAMGLAAGMGYGIKATAAIMLIAVFIDALLFWDMKKALTLAAIGLAGLFLCSQITQAVIYRHLDRTEAERIETPIVHWVMMGSVGKGWYDPDECEFTKSFSDPGERKRAVTKRLFERIGEYDAGDIAELFTGKLDIDFGDGTYGLSDCLGCPHGEDNILHSFLLNDGDNREAYKTLCTGVVIAMYVLLIASCVIDIFSKSAAHSRLAPRIALLGLLLFLLIWEARWRYFSNHIPVFMVCAVLGLGSVTRLLTSRRSKA